MSTSSDTNMSIAAILAGTALVFSAHHTFKFDKWGCLLPKRREWFRVLLTWMLIGSNVGILAWAIGWSVARYTLGWVYIPDIGAIPYPSIMFEKKWVDLNMPLMIIFNLAFSIQASLNAEEGLYWYHLMRAVRQPKASRSWLRSSLFFAWIITSLICAGLQSGVVWLKLGDERGKPLNLDLQMARTLTVHGAIELAVMLSASAVIWKFPKFLQDVKASGAGPDVRSRLHFYHEANKIRTFFRAFFAISMLTLGVDALTDKMVVNMNHLAQDILTQICFGSFFFILIISTILYVPRSWMPESVYHHQQIMVGEPNQTGAWGGGPIAGQMGDNGEVYGGAQLASGIALLSLLREGGQWDGDDDLRAVQVQPQTQAHALNGDKSPAGPGSEQYGTARPQSWNDGSVSTIKREGDWDSEGGSHLGVPMALENFTSPIGVQSAESLPSEIRIHVDVAREVHRDSDSVIM